MDRNKEEGIKGSMDTDCYIKEVGWVVRMNMAIPMGVSLFKNAPPIKVFYVLFLSFRSNHSFLYHVEYFGENLHIRIWSLKNVKQGL